MITFNYITKFRERKLLSSFSLHTFLNNEQSNFFFVNIFNFILIEIYYKSYNAIEQINMKEVIIMFQLETENWTFWLISLRYWNTILKETETLESFSLHHIHFSRIVVFYKNNNSNNNNNNPHKKQLIYVKKTTFFFQSLLSN